MNGSVDQSAAQALTNGALAQKLDTLALWPREEREALLREASQRLRWSDIYAQHGTQRLKRERP